MKKIYKYPLKIIDRQNIMMPEGAQILTVQMQGGTPCLWALVDPEVSSIPETFFLRGTGHSSEGEGEARYISTFQMNEGALVFHVFHA